MSPFVERMGRLSCVYGGSPPCSHESAALPTIDDTRHSGGGIKRERPDDRSGPFTQTHLRTRTCNTSSEYLNQGSATVTRTGEATESKLRPGPCQQIAWPRTLALR